MKATYKLELEQQQRRLGLTHNQLNRLDRKHNDHNLIKKLQSLEPKASASTPPNTGWYGTLLIGNGEETGKNVTVRLETVDGPVVNEIIPNTVMTSDDLDTDYIFYTLTIENRLKSPSTIIKMYYTFTAGTNGTATDNEGGIYGLFIVSNTYTIVDDVYIGGVNEYTVESGLIEDGGPQILFTLY
jgi:hypothetical protein